AAARGVAPAPGPDGPVSARPERDPGDEPPSRRAEAEGGRGRNFLLVQTAAGVLALVLLVWRVDLRAAFSLLPNLELAWALAGVFVFTASKAVHAYRWRQFLRHRAELTMRFVFPLFLVSNLANALIPFRAGDLIRIELPSRQFGI